MKTSFYVSFVITMFIGAFVKVGYEGYWWMLISSGFALFWVGVWTGIFVSKKRIPGIPGISRSEIPPFMKDGKEYIVLEDFHSAYGHMWMLATLQDAEAWKERPFWVFTKTVKFPKRFKVCQRRAFTLKGQRERYYFERTD